MIAEFLLEVVFQLLFEWLGELGLRLLDTRAGRLVASALAGLAGGAVWGAVLSNRGHTDLPKTFWLALVFAVAGVIASFVMRASVRPGADPDTEYRAALAPWRWAPRQWESFALLNAFVALGVALGFGVF